MIKIQTAIKNCIIANLLIATFSIQFKITTSFLNDEKNKSKISTENLDFLLILKSALRELINS